MVDHTGTKTKNVLQRELYLISSICTLPLYKNKSFFHENYIEKGLSLRQIAKLTASSKTTIREALASYNIPIRKKGSCYNNPHFPKFGQRKVNGKLVDHKREQ